MEAEHDSSSYGSPAYPQASVCGSRLCVSGMHVVSYDNMLCGCNSLRSWVDIVLEDIGTDVPKNRSQLWKRQVKIGPSSSNSGASGNSPPLML